VTVLRPDAADDRRIAEELAAWAQARAVWAVAGWPETGLGYAGACPRCGSPLKYLPNHSVATFAGISAVWQHAFVVWCDRVDCLVVSDGHGEGAC
jgi:hypothetical protein